MPLKLADLTSNELESLPKGKTVFFFPVSALEDHGPHLPLSSDLNEAQSLAYVLAERTEKEIEGWRSVLMPPLALGVSTVTTRAALQARGHVLRDALVDQCLSLARMGFVHFAAVTATQTPKHLTAIEEAGRIVMRSGRSGLRKLFPFLPLKPGCPVLVSASSATVDPIAAKKAPFWPDPEEHGGARDTSVQLAVAPESVRAEWKHLPRLDRPHSRWTRFRLRKSHRLSGYWGTPKTATPEAGREILKRQVDEMFSKLRVVWAGGDPLASFRSWYGWLPPNGSFFKAWILATILGAFLVLWTLFSVTAMIQ